MTDNTAAKTETVSEKDTAVEVPVENAVKTEAAPADDSTVEANIVRQVEYYFGDANLPRDKFLQAEMKKDDGCNLLKLSFLFYPNV